MQRQAALLIASQYRSSITKDAAIPIVAYTRAFITQIAQGCACNQYHSVEQQLCRWFLLTLDRLGSGELIMTHELMANLLAVRREGITGAAGKLQQAGVICDRRGRITVLDRAGLQEGVCECYEVVKKEFDRLYHDAREYGHNRFTKEIR